jgi:hypothetical protein
MILPVIHGVRVWSWNSSRPSFKIQVPAIFWLSDSAQADVASEAMNAVSNSSLIGFSSLVDWLDAADLCSAAARRNNTSDYELQPCRSSTMVAIKFNGTFLVTSENSTVTTRHDVSASPWWVWLAPIVLAGRRGHRSSYHYQRSALPTFADYAIGMRKPIRRDGDRKSKPVADTHNEVAHTAESVLPPKKPPAPSVKHRLKRGRKAKLLKWLSLASREQTKTLKKLQTTAVA